MTLYQVLSFLGVGGIITGALIALIRYVRGVTKGVQALLRAQLITDWNHYSAEGFAPIYARENFENCYQQYHNLGANGVMDDIRNKFLALPDKPKDDA